MGYSVLGYWRERPDTPGQCAELISGFLRALREHMPGLELFKPKSRARAPNVVASTSVEEVERALLLTGERKVDSTPETSIGLTYACWGRNADYTLQVLIRCCTRGRESPPWNVLTMELSPRFDSARTTDLRELLTRAFRSVISIFGPEWATVVDVVGNRIRGPHHLPSVGWIGFAQIADPVSEIDVRCFRQEVLPGQGLLVVTVEREFSSKDQAAVAIAESANEALVQEYRRKS